LDWGLLTTERAEGSRSLVEGFFLTTEGAEETEAWLGDVDANLFWSDYEIDFDGSGFC
jgi:hypothetical protein